MALIRFPRRSAGRVALGFAALAGAAGFAEVHSTAAAAALAQVASLVSCASTSPCASWTNSNSGPGLTGSNTKNGYGVGGYASSNDGVYGYSATGNGVVGKTGGNTAPGVAGYSGSNVGVYGSAHGSGTGLKGYSEHGYGLYGVTLGDGFGVVGSATSGTGVYAVSTSGDGTETFTDSATALYASAGTGKGVVAYSDSGRAVDASTSGGLTVLAQNYNGNAGDFTGSYIGLIGRAPASGGFPLLATDSSGHNLFYVDGAGNVFYHGGLHTFARGAGGATVRTMAPTSTTATVEDTGSAQLVGGVATVRLDPTFASAIESGAYRIFVTPYGDTHGLYVALKTPAGFVVREAQGGRSSVAFDYRIVGTALGHAAERMSLVNPATEAGLQPHAPIVAPAAVKPRVVLHEPKVANP